MEIRLIGDPVLRKRAKKVEKIDENLKDVIDEMFSTMYLYDGVGLAAPQVGISLRFFIMDSRENEGDSLTANKV